MSKPFSRKNPEYKKNQLIAQNKRRRANPEKYKEMGRQSEFNRRLKRYGITTEEYYQRLIQQQNRCKICTTDLQEGKFSHVDHNHNTGKVRGLLCHHCNFLLGNAKENILILEKAIVYLKENLS